MDLTPINDARADDEAHRRLDELWRRGCVFLGAKYAILGGAMTWVSESRLVSAISNAGGFGVVACGSLSPDALGAEIAATSEKTDRPFGVNLITIHPELTELIDACIGLGVGHVILAGGLPPKTAITRVRDSGAKVVCFAPTLLVGRKLVRQGADALIIEGMEAGGHTGPVSTGVLAQEILPHLRDVPIFVGGGIGRGESIASYLEMGASGVQLGTRFVCARESIAHPKFKQLCIRANARDAQLSVQLDPMFPVIPVRALPNKATEKFTEVQRAAIEKFREGKIGQKDAQLEIERFWAGSLRRAVIEGDVENGSLMAGQSVGMVSSEQPMAEIFDQLIGQILATLSGHNRHGP